MSNNFTMNSSGWDYADLAKLAKKHGGPEKLMNDIYNDGRAADIAKAGLVGATVGIVVFECMLKWLSSKRKKKIEELILQQEIEIDENLDMGTGADL